MIVLLTVIALAIAEGGRRDPARWGAPGTKLSLASGVALLATTIAAACSGRTEVLGLAPIAVGIGLRALAMRELGDAFTSETAFVPGRPIVEAGLYRWTRHPSDLGLMLYAAGLAILGASTVAGAFAIVVASTAALRVVEEERRKKMRSRSGGGWRGGWRYRRALRNQGGAERPPPSAATDVDRAKRGRLREEGEAFKNK